MINNAIHDVTAMRIHLNELKSRFDLGLIEGKSFEQVKKIYMEIKELEYQISVFEWKPVNIFNGKQRRI